MGQREDNIKIQFPVAHFFLIGWELFFQLYKKTGSEAFLTWKEKEGNSSNWGLVCLLNKVLVVLL